MRVVFGYFIIALILEVAGFFIDRQAWKEFRWGLFETFLFITRTVISLMIWPWTWFHEYPKWRKLRMGVKRRSGREMKEGE